MFQRFATYFMRGLLVVVPAAAAIYVVWLTVTTVDRTIASILRRPVIPGVGFLLTVVLIVLIGALASGFAMRWLFGAIDRLFKRTPLVQLIYTSLRDLIDAFVGEKRRFDRPVVVRVGDGVEVLGFVTRDDLAALGLPGRAAVYLPQSYNFAGNLIVVPAERVRPLAVDSRTAMTLIVSGGVSGSAEASAKA
ncbi:MAG: hypothetical protein H6Q01_754 [Acidobacteria bacterium]|nr:hypothetical protein [Acidobacteriota bacterium]